MKKIKKALKELLDFFKYLSDDIEKKKSYEKWDSNDEWESDE